MYLFSYCQERGILEGASPFPSWPASAENSEDSVSDPYGVTILQPTHHSLSSGIGKYILNYLQEQGILEGASM